MSKERATRRAAREREAAIRAAGRAGEAERRERREARRRSVQRAADRLPRRGPVGRDTGVLARRRRRVRALLVVLLVTANLVVWVVAPQWEARVAALVLTVLLAPMLLSLLARRH